MRSKERLHGSQEGDMDYIFQYSPFHHVHSLGHSSDYSDYKLHTPFNMSDSTELKDTKMMTDDEEVIKTVNRDADIVADLVVTSSKLEPTFNVWSLAFMTFCTSVTWEAISSAMAQGLTSGGSTSLVWGFVACSIGAMLTISCFAEYASMIPTAGGQHHFVFALAPPKFRRILSWYVGWMTMLGWILCTLAGTFAAAMQIQSWAILFSQDYIYERWHTTLVRCPRLHIAC